MFLGLGKKKANVTRKNGKTDCSSYLYKAATENLIFVCNFCNKNC